MKYSINFERDFNWYLSVRHIFNFDGRLDREIYFDKEGISGKECFYLFDSKGKIEPTRHPNIVKSLLKTKGSVNLHIKMFKEDRKKGVLPKILFKEMLVNFKNPPKWFEEAVEK